MARRGVRQVTMAGAVDIPQSQLSKRLRCKIAFDVEELHRIAEYLDVDVTVFWNPSADPWPNGRPDGPSGPNGGGGGTRQRDLDRAARRHRRYDDEGEGRPRYASAA